MGSGGTGVSSRENNGLGSSSPSCPGAGALAGCAAPWWPLLAGAQVLSVSESSGWPDTSAQFPECLGCGRRGPQHCHPQKLWS